jgi:hypothetical protein
MRNIPRAVERLRPGLLVVEKCEHIERLGRPCREERADRLSNSAATTPRYLRSLRGRQRRRRYARNQTGRNDVGADGRPGDAEVPDETEQRPPWRVRSEGDGQGTTEAAAVDSNERMDVADD